jgi:phosphate:Na+ symporter
MLLALTQLLSLLTPYEDVPSLRLLLGAIATVPVIAVIFAAAVTWAAHSSVAVVLLIMSFAAQGAVPPQAAFALVLGANLGTALNPLFEAGDPMTKRLPLGNLLNRAVGCALGLALLGKIGPWLVVIEPNVAREVADFHTLFNLVIAALFFPVLRPFARLLRWMLPAHAAPADPSLPVYLDQSALEVPSLALAAASREALRMADVLETMLQGALDALASGDRKRIAETKRLDDVLDRLNSALKAYLTSLDHETLDADDDRRLSEILAFITNLEHAGDIAERGVAANLAKQVKRNLAFSPQGSGEIREMLQRLVKNVRAAAAVFMTDDVRAARGLLGEKEVFRDLETRATEAHFARVRAGRVESVETSAQHLDMLRDLKRINAHVAAAAYPVLEKRGELLSSRLRQDS